MKTKLSRLALGVISLSAISLCAYAHDPNAQPKPPSAWKGTNVSLGGSANTGNTTAQQANSALNISYRVNKWLWTSNNTFNFARTKGKGVTTSKLYLMGQAQYNFSQKNYSFEQLNYTDDRFDGYRYTANALLGYGRHLFDYESVSLDGQLGPGIQRTVKEDTPTDDGKTKNLLAFSGTLNLNWQMSKNGTFSEIFNVTSSSQNVRYLSTTSISANVMNHVALQLSFQASKDSKPLPGKKATNTVTTIALVYTFA